MGYTDMVRMPLDSGADVNHVTEGHRPALAVAAREGNSAVVNLLIERGAVLTTRGTAAPLSQKQHIKATPTS